MKLRALTLIIGLVLVSLGACSDDDGDGTADPTSTQPAATAATTQQTPGSSDETPPGGVNIPEVDDNIVAVLSNDPAKLRPRVRFSSAGCVFAEGPGGSSPPCRSDETEGTEVEVVPVSTCEGEYRRQDEMDGLAEMLDADSLFGVYRGPANQGPDGDYIAVFTRNTGGDEGAIAVTIDEGVIVYFKFSCGETPNELIELLGLGEPVCVTP